MAFVPESLPANRRHSHGLGETIKVMARMWKEPVYRWFSVVMFMSYAHMFTYMGTCTLTIQVQLDQPSWVGAVALALNGGSIVVTSWIAGQLSKRISGIAITLMS